MPARPRLLPAEALHLDRQLCFALYSASLQMTKVYKPLLAELGVTYPQYLVLLVLWEQDDRTVSELGDRLFLDSGTLTPLLKRMEAAGLVDRRRDDTDERVVRITLTDDGRALERRARAIPGALVQAAGCSLDEVTGLTRRLQELRGMLAGHAGD